MKQFSPHDTEAAHNCWAQECADTINALVPHIDIIRDAGYLSVMTALAMHDVAIYANGANRLAHYAMSVGGVRYEIAVLLLRTQHGATVFSWQFESSNVPNLPHGMRFTKRETNDIADATMAQTLYDSVVWQVINKRTKGWHEIWF